MGFGGACCGARTGGALDGPEVQSPGFREAIESRQDVARCTHVAGFFLNPDNLAPVGMLADGCGTFRARQRAELATKENSGTAVLAASAFRAQPVSDSSAG